MLQRRAEAFNSAGLSKQLFFYVLANPTKQSASRRRENPVYNLSPHARGAVVATDPSRIHDPDPICFAEEFELDLGSYELRRAGQPVRLERIPMDLLLLLIERYGQLVTRDEIVARIWGSGVHLDTD